MLFGSVSGGVSAELAGGNFWQGAATGLTVSALNHLMHEISAPLKKSFRQQLRAKGIKPGGKFGYTADEYINIVDAIDELSELHNQTDSRTNSIIAAGEVYGNGVEAFAATEMLEDGSYNIHISRSKVRTNIQLAYTYGHEMYHIFDHGNMTYNQWLNQTPSQIYNSEIRTYRNFDLKNNIPGAIIRINYYQGLLNNLPK